MEQKLIKSLFQVVLQEQVSLQLPAGASSLVVNYVSGAWDSEVTFQITRNGDNYLL